MKSEYQIACETAAREQGVDVVIERLAARGIEAALWQTGGYTMCFGLKAGSVADNADVWVQGNACCAAVFPTCDCQPESMIATIVSFDESGDHGVEVADAVAAWFERRIADTFDTLLRDDVSSVSYRKIIRQNSSNPNDAACASHDYCDANMVMARAMEACGIDGEPPTLWNAAWDVWREVYCVKGGDA